MPAVSPRISAANPIARGIVASSDGHGTVSSTAPRSPTSTTTEARVARGTHRGRRWIARPARNPIAKAT